MSNVNGVNNNNISFQTLDPAALSQQDFIAAVYLERGSMLDGEVRRIAKDIETSNNLLHSVNTLINKANIAQYSDSNYDAPTWTQNGKNIVLDNGYGLGFQTDDAGNTSFTLVDAEGNQLIYKDKTLIPVAAGGSADASEVGIPVMNDMTMVLDDGTEITFETGAAGVAFDSSDFSGGLADIQTITIKRGNQGMTINDVNTADPKIVAAALNGNTLDTLDNDGHVLLEAGGLNSWEYDGVNLASLTRTDPNDADVQVSGYSARKLAFQNNLNEEYSGGLPALTSAEKDIITNTLKITLNDSSGEGRLTQQEWATLKTGLQSAKENLTGSNQLQTVQLQRALTTHNQNYDAMSNAENKIYSLLRDIVNNIK
ncbi:hypothetical protein GZ77_10120 [Endozoicomonas montiporae]|uniref:DUF1521 domain-containing protein n=2 Tax=Endozoicomonas montiporae TaxID=1027273 RepID=A0A081N888_9GAMM|nr:hypothetical protein [Endozoicomonas montiporae]AMO55452.1 hypothetical protein EZMO1_1259 [Endozoicomonas montiporae CL-33]KEQ14661.1 hypothetical protein GZ77_10120 [Endozoicomonas montiporae]